jgi:hypothetical protein
VDPFPHGGHELSEAEAEAEAAEGVELLVTAIGVNMTVERVIAGHLYQFRVEEALADAEGRRRERGLFGEPTPDQGGPEEGLMFFFGCKVATYAGVAFDVTEVVVAPALSIPPPRQAIALRSPTPPSEHGASFHPAVDDCAAHDGVTTINESSLAQDAFELRAPLMGPPSRYSVDQSLPALLSLRVRG